MKEGAVSRVFLFSLTASTRAATSRAGLSRKPPAFCCAAKRERTSCSSVSSPAHACRRNVSRCSSGCSSTDCKSPSTCFHRLLSIAGLARELAVEPGFGSAPVPHHGNRRHFEHLSRDREKMSAILPLHAFVVHQPHIRFVDQSGSLQAVAGTLTFHIVPRETVEFVIDDRGQPVEHAAVPVG